MVIVDFNFSQEKSRVSLRTPLPAFLPAFWEGEKTPRGFLGRNDDVDKGRQEGD